MINMMQEDEYYRYARFHGNIKKTVLIGSITSLLIGLIITSLVPVVTEPSGYFLIERDGPSGYSSSFITKESASLSELELFQTHNFTLESGWRSRILYSITPSGEWHQTDDGLQISGSDMDITLQYLLNVPVEEYLILHFSAAFEALEGTPRVGISTHFGAFSTLWASPTGRSNITVLEMDEYRVFSLAVQIDEVCNISQGWIQQARLEIEVHFNDFASVIVHNATSTAVTSSPLVPFSFDFRDSANESMYANKNSRMMGYPPSLNITETQMNQTASVFQWVSDDRIYLTPGEYKIDYGWFLLYNASISEYGECLIVLSPDQEGYLTMQINCMRVYLSLPQDQSHDIQVWIYGRTIRDNWFFEQSRVIYNFRDFFPADSFLYAPGRIDEVLVYGIDPSQRLYENPVSLDGTHDLLIRIAENRFPFFGVSFDVIQMFAALVLLSMIFASLISLRKAQNPLPLAKWIHRERFIPTLLMFVGYCLPWFSINTSIATVSGITTETTAVFLPIGVEAMRESSKNWIVYLYGVDYYLRPSSILDYYDIVGVLPIIAMIFWIPLFILVVQYLDDSKIKSTWTSVLPYAIPGCVSLFYLLWNTSYLTLGAIPVVASMILFSFRALSRTQKWNSLRVRIGRDVHETR
ncbi:MAG: hypothetical protein ACFFED_06695 [Candidatus Thorarchaeota archaeon]